MLRIKIFFTFLFLIFCKKISAQQIFTLEEATNMALQNNFSIKIVKNQQRIAENEWTLGNAGYLPLITAGGQASNTYFFLNRQRRFFNDSTTVSNYDKTTNTNINSNLTLNWTIFNGFGMQATYKKIGRTQGLRGGKCKSYH